MKLIVAGASHGVPEKHRFCTSLFLQVGEKTYIMDAGAPISALLDRYDIPHNTVKAVFITHGHTDHINGLPAFCSELMWWIGIPRFSTRSRPAWMPLLRGVRRLESAVVPG